MGRCSTVSKVLGPGLKVCLFCRAQGKKHQWLFPGQALGGQGRRFMSWRNDQEPAGHREQERRKRGGLNFVGGDLGGISPGQSRASDYCMKRKSVRESAGWNWKYLLVSRTKCKPSAWAPLAPVRSRSVRRCRSLGKQRRYPKVGRSCRASTGPHKPREVGVSHLASGGK